MSSCCDSSTNKTNTSTTCPSCGQTAKSVPRQTLMHHLQSPWRQNLAEQVYYFCEQEQCDVVYIGENQQTFTKTDLRQTVGVKSTDPSALICYCFGVTRDQAQTDPQIKQFVTEQTKQGICSCVTHNPSGKCCLKDFKFK